VRDIISVKVSSERVSSHHSESFGDRLPVGLGLLKTGTSTTREVVDSQSTVVYERKRTIGPLVVHLRVPVVRVVDLSDGARGAAGGLEVVIDIDWALSLLVLVEVVSSKDFMDVSTQLSGANDGIDTSSIDRTAVAEDLPDGTTSL